MILKAFLIWVLIAGAETVHGIVRMRLLNRRVGKHRANQIGVFTGSVIILIIAWYTVPWFGVLTRSDYLWIGILWLVQMLTFEVVLGRYVFRVSWQRIAADFDPRQGGLLSIGMAVLMLAPLLVAKLRGLI